MARINSTVVVTCTAEGGDPPPSLAWTSSAGQRQLRANETSAPGTVTSRLALHRLGPSDAGQSLTCSAPNHSFKHPPSASVRLDVLLAPVRVAINRAQEPFVAGRRYNLSCQVQGSHPPPDTSLWARGAQLPVLTRSHSSDGRLFTTVSQFKPEPEDDGTFLTCRAVNRHFPGEALEDQWRIRVEWAPRSSITLAGTLEEVDDELRIKEGSSVSLVCSASSHPPAYAFHWRHKGLALKEGLEGQLTLPSVTREQSGDYSCLAENSQVMVAVFSFVMSSTSYRVWVNRQVSVLLLPFPLPASRPSSFKLLQRSISRLTSSARWTQSQEM